MGRDEQYPLVGIQLLAQRAIRCVSAEIGSLLQKIFSRPAAFHEMFERTLGRTETIRGYQWLRGVCFGRAVRNHRHYAGVELRNITVRRRRRFHDVLDDHSANEILRGRNVFAALCDGPFVWSSLEIPLRFRKSFRCVKYALLRGFEVNQRLVLVRLRCFLCTSSRSNERKAGTQHDSYPSPSHHHVFSLFSLLTPCRSRPLCDLLRSQVL